MNLRFDVQRLTLTVGYVDHMEADPCVIHPFVRTWLVDGLTGHMLHHERNAHGHYTHPCDLRIRQIVSPSWGEDVPLDVLDNITKHRPEAMLLFEIMDFPSENIRGERMYPQTLRYVAWGYLKLLDHRRRPNLHRDIAVQLFRYPYERSYLKTLFYMLLPARFASNHCGSVPANATPLPYGSPNVPTVYSIYLNPQNRMEKYGAALYVRIEPRPELQMSGLADDTRHPREIAALEEILTHVSGNRKHSIHSMLGQRTPAVTPRSVTASSVTTVAVNDDPGPLLLCARRRGEPCAPLAEMRFLGTLPSATQGCTWISFSSCGKYLVCGVSGGEGCEVVAYDVRHESMRRIAKFRGHHKTIYECTFSPDSAMVLSCSADGTARVWAMPTGKPNALLTPDEDGCVASMAHPCYVYTAVFVFDDAHIATGGFDGLVRIWSVATAAEVRVLERQPSRITRLVFDVTGGRLWCIDGSSVLCVWRLQKTGSGDISSAEKPKTTDMFADKGAVELQVLHGTTVMVQTACDGCATIMDAIGFRVRRRLTGLSRGTVPVHAVLSPDASTVFCGSLGGCIQAWDVATGNVIGPVSGHRMSGLSDADDDCVPYYRVVWSPVDNKIAACTYAAHVNVIHVWWSLATPEGTQPPVSRSIVGRSAMMKSLRTSRTFARSAALDVEQSSRPSGSTTNDERLNAIRQIVRKWGEAVRKRVTPAVTTGTPESMV